MAVTVKDLIEYLSQAPDGLPVFLTDKDVPRESADYLHITLSGALENIEGTDG